MSTTKSPVTKTSSRFRYIKGNILSKVQRKVLLENNLRLFIFTLIQRHSRPALRSIAFTVKLFSTNNLILHDRCHCEKALHFEFHIRCIQKNVLLYWVFQKVFIICKIFFKLVKFYFRIWFSTLSYIVSVSKFF